MLKGITDNNMFLLNTYAEILDRCSNKMAIKFIVYRVFRILSKHFKVRKPADFPQTSHDIQIVCLVDYIKSNKLAYAYLYASSLNAHYGTKKPLKTFKKQRGFLSRFRAYFGV